MKFFERFLGKKNEFDEYEDIYDNGDDDGIDYSELDGYEFEEDPEETIEQIRGTITRGDCLICHAKDGMKYDGFICFICSECGNSVDEDTYYRWVAGYPVTFED